VLRDLPRSAGLRSVELNAAGWAVASAFFTVIVALGLIVGLERSNAVCGRALGHARGHRPSEEFPPSQGKAAATLRTAGRGRLATQRAASRPQRLALVQASASAAPTGELTGRAHADDCVSAGNRPVRVAAVLARPGSRGSADHAGGGAEVRDLTGAPVALHPADTTLHEARCDS
jgi:hypothetical protein